MKLTRQAIADVVLIEPSVHGDERGYFFESFRQDRLEETLGHAINFTQDNESLSSRGVLRGLHYQLPPYAQSKLVRVISGEVIDVAVDIRLGSPTFGQHVKAHLSGDNKHQLFVPRGFAHGFIVLSEQAIFAYKVDNGYAPEHDCGIHYNDAALGIDWQLDASAISTSGKDAELPTLLTRQQTAPDTLFEYGKNYYAQQ
ncbi:dTDP-4-dehydrorhamnose 3,5-epimerase [uncultured Gilvimarinus sp.]|uniref:dTDP-4-dehydrorhamnose 3,5-epimerase n=1 Tax=uncultured Gilvimarinus sp. TaxID=1689143 RepID=UPI0030EF0B29|tara:strand:+ start:1134 stop:1730 length:597 start_codon:yes stop_codon:yes gene_type:complete